MGDSQQCNEKLENGIPLSVPHTHTHTPFFLFFINIIILPQHTESNQLLWERVFALLPCFFVSLYHVSACRLLKKCWCHAKQPADRFSSITLKLNICLSLCKSREGKVAKLWPSVGYSLWVCFRVILIMMTCFSLSCYFFQKHRNTSARPKLKHFPMRIITCT